MVVAVGAFQLHFLDAEACRVPNFLEDVERVAMKDLYGFVVVLFHVVLNLHDHKHILNQKINNIRRYLQMMHQLHHPIRIAIPAKCIHIWTLNNLSGYII